jgi:PITH domain
MSHNHGHDHSHGHSHSHGDGHDHSHDLEPALQSNLYKQINFDSIITLNEAESGSGAAIVQKTWAERLSDDPHLESDADEQVLMHVPFAGSCKLYSILIRTSDSPSAPLTLKLFRNRDDLDFSTASDLKPTQKLTLPRTNDVAEIPLNRAQWNMTTSINLFFEDNHSGGEEDVTKISYLGFKGDFMALNREPVNVLYEAAANPSDHKVIQGLKNVNQQMPGQ